jgi:hypothetical protein
VRGTRAGFREEKECCLQLLGYFASSFWAKQSCFDIGAFACAGHFVLGRCALGLGLLSRGLGSAAIGVIFAILRVTSINRDSEGHENG